MQLANGVSESLPCDANWWPDLAATRARLADTTRPPVRSVYLVTPGNPTGVTVPASVVDELVAITRDAGVWLILDGTYAAFSSQTIHLPSALHVIHVGSFSKAYGAAGWRVGYIVYPVAEGGQGAADTDPLGSALLKIQDTMPIHAAHASQALALACLQDASAGPAWVAARIASLAPSRTAARAALAPLGESAVAGGDAIYFWVNLLPLGCTDDWAFVRWLVAQHGVAVVPGSACGAPGHVRVAFGKPAPGPEFEEAAARLGRACAELAEGGFKVVEAWAKREREAEGGRGGEAAAKRESEKS